MLHCRRKSGILFISSGTVPLDCFTHMTHCYYLIYYYLLYSRNMECLLGWVGFILCWWHSQLQAANLFFAILDWLAMKAMQRRGRFFWSYKAFVAKLGCHHLGRLDLKYEQDVIHKTDSCLEHTQREHWRMCVAQEIKRRVGSPGYIAPEAQPQNHEQTLRAWLVSFVLDIGEPDSLDC